MDSSQILEPCLLAGKDKLICLQIPSILELTVLWQQVIFIRVCNSQRVNVIFCYAKFCHTMCLIKTVQIKETKFPVKVNFSEVTAILE